MPSRSDQLAATARWHPIVAADEQEPGVWLMRGQLRPYAVIVLVRRGGELGYRAVTWA